MSTTVPTYDQFIDPLFRVLERHPDGLSTAKAHDLVADEVGLTQRQRDEILPSGRQAYYKNRIGWAFDRLKRAGAAESVTRGHWALTQEGREFIEAHPQPLNEHEVGELSRVETADTVLVRLSEGEIGSLEEASEARSQAERLTPEEAIESSVDQLHESVSRELLQHILDAPPEFFERLVLDVLLAMGYGADRRSLTHVGGVNDGGIDGIITLDRLGLEKVYIQAKRWARENKVGRPDLQGFYGALASRKANKGVFITTSAFTEPAREFAAQVSDGIVLVDGPMLTRLMIEFGVGVSTQRVVRIVQVDTDYFEDA